MRIENAPVYLLVDAMHSPVPLDSEHGLCSDLTVRFCMFIRYSLEIGRAVVTVSR